MSTDMDIVIKVALDTTVLRKQAKQLLEFADALDYKDKQMLDGVGAEATLDTTPVDVELTTPTPPAIAPTIPPPPGAIIPPPPAAHVPSDPIELDSEGLPWDERIHSSSRKKYAKDNKQTGTKAGSWKRARGVQPLTVDQVKAELRLKYLDPAPDFAVATPPAAPATPTPPAPVAPISVSPDSDLYLPLMKKCTGRIAALELTLEDIVAICKRHGLNGIAQLASRADLIPTIEAEIEALWIRNTQG